MFIFALIYTKATLFWIYLWQLKEYRLDRFWSEYGFLGKLLHFWAFSGGRKFHRPVFTIKVLLTYAVSLLVVLTGIYAILQAFFYGAIISAWFIIFGLLVLYILVPIVVLLVIYIFQIPIILAKFFIYKMATARVAQNKNLIIIGITGSYGKSSTKEFLAQILEKKFKVIKTPKNVNTEIGVAKFILRNLTPALSLERRGGAVIFIVEMGAYKKGEIKRICDIVKPKIGIITGINEQHLALFGSFKNIVDTKYELIESLPENGLAVFNGENQYCVEMAGRWGGEKIVYNVANLPLLSPPPYQGGEVGGLPAHYLQNLVGAIEVAKYLGMTDEEIAEAVENIKLTERMIKTFIGRNDALIIDDLYSANPDGVLAGLDFLAQQPQKTKIVVMPCLIELSSMAEEVHKKIGKKIVEVCDLAIITTKDYFDIIKGEVGAKAVLSVALQKAIELLENKLNEDTAVLLEGRVAEDVIRFLKSS